MYSLLAFTLVFNLLSTYAQNDPSENAEYWNELAAERLREKLRLRPLAGPFPKNVIFFLGDGMGSTVITGARRLRAQRENGKYLNRPLNMEEFEFTGLVKTSSYDKHVTDSAAGAVALFTGYKVLQKSLGTFPGNTTNIVFDAGEAPDCAIDSNYFINDGIAELAVNKNKNVGFVTTTRITHATPAALYAKGVNRYVESDDEFTQRFYPNCKNADIAGQLLNHPADKFKVLMGGGRSGLHPQSQGGSRIDEREIDLEWQKLDTSRRLINSFQELEDFKPTTDEKVLGLFHDSHFPYQLDEKANGTKTVPRLAEMTQKAIQVLQINNTNGYFLMIEAGHIDMAEHLNQLRKSFEEVLELDDAVQMAKTLTDPSETLIIVTADHSHALSMPGYLSTSQGILETFNVENRDRMPGFLFAAGPGETTRSNYSKEESENKDFAAPSHIFTESGYHGGEDVPLYAHGPYSWLFSGSLENTEVAYRIKYLMCLNHESRLCKNFKNKDADDDLLGSGDLVTRVQPKTLVTITVLALTVASISLVASLTLSFIIICRKIQNKNKNFCFSYPPE
ncbi:unnamed protein product [Auanema sp. JU1783]|nr:unnamed protein product [Auanema sp. JU1783]